MNEKISLKNLLSDRQTAEENLELFALLHLGVLDSLNHGVLSASRAIHIFYHAENGLFVRQQLQHPTADEMMSRGIQLPDLFDILPAEEAQQEFRRELTQLHALNLSLLEKQLVPA
jgi:hypothetical protein